ncbi:MAG TPA: hypothetical protein VEQ09_11255 [Aquabacterium sp.]|nr:hypothetical protein [Aquabacterium sp.]
MIETVMTFDLLPGIDMQAYQAWVAKAVETVSKQPGLVEFHANRSLLGCPMQRTVTVWKTAEDWVRFDAGPWQTMGMEMHRYATNSKVEVWGPSPVVAGSVKGG